MPILLPWSLLLRVSEIRPNYEYFLKLQFLNSNSNTFSKTRISATQYVLWILHIKDHTGQWVYPFLAAAGYTKVLTVVLPLTIGTCGITALIGIRLNDSKFDKVKKQ